MEKKSFWLGVLVTLLLIVLMGGVAAGTIYYTGKDAVEKKFKVKEDQEEDESLEDNEGDGDIEVELLPGIIEGALSYPSDFIPEGITICAESTDLDDPICTTDIISDSKYQYGYGYRLEVPAGKYYVYATVPDMDDYRAYYNEFVNCGLQYGCESHDLIEVIVNSGQTVTGIDPWDWYQ